MMSNYGRERGEEWFMCCEKRHSRRNEGSGQDDVGEACLSPWAMVTFGPELLSRSMSGSMVLTQPASVRALTVQVATKVQRDA